MRIHRLTCFALSILCLSASAVAQSGNHLVQLLKEDQVAFGNFVREKTPDEARQFGANADIDFLFYDMEHGEFDIPTLEAFLEALRATSRPQTVIVRIPPIHDDPGAAQTRTEALIAAGADGVAFPHIMSAEEAKRAVGWIEAKTDRMWPNNPAGDFVSFVMIEDPDVVPHSEAITRTPGVSIFSPGPGSLRGAYDGDMAKVKKAVDAVLAACKAASVPCANTARESDVEPKVEAGFRLLIAMGEGTLELGRKAAGR